jgi:hypothetical protein
MQLPNFQVCLGKGELGGRWILMFVYEEENSVAVEFSCSFMNRRIRRPLDSHVCLGRGEFGSHWILTLI